MAGLMSRPLTIKMRTGVFKVRIRGPYNSIPNVEWMILGVEIIHVVVVNNWKYGVNL